MSERKRFHPEHLRIFLLFLAPIAFAATGEPPQKENPLGELAAKVEFEPGTDILTRAGKVELTRLVEEARSKGEIDKVRVLSWADREYPRDGEEIARVETYLADERATVVQEFLEEQLKVSDVDTFNMARRPGTLKRIFRTPEFRVKDQAEESGIAPSALEVNHFFEDPRASTALVVADLKE